MKNKTNNAINKIIAIVVILAIITILYLAYLLFIKQEVSYASTDTEAVQYEIINNININMEEVISNQTNQPIREEIITEEVDLEYITKYTNNPNLPKGMIQVLQEGIEGKQQVIMKKTYQGDECIKEEQIGNQVTKAAVNKMVQVGTGNYSSNYEIKVGDTLYVTANFLAVRVNPDESSEKIITVYQDSEVKMLQMKEEWYQIKYQTYTGWAKADCFTYLDPKANLEEQDTTSSSQYTKQELLNQLSFNMALNKPSGLSLEQFKKIFENEERDTKNIFANNAQYFYYAEKQYNVNGVFLAAVAIHESGWGGSSIATDKNNLFGYGAYDRNPYDSAYEFSDYSEGIDLLARVFVKYYLNPEGTKIYDGNVADGCYYNGNTLTAVNQRYATDKNWANGVYYWMEYLYNNL